MRPDVSLPRQVRGLRDHPLVHGLRRPHMVPHQLIEGFPVDEDLIALLLADRMTRNRRRRRHEDGMAVGYRVPQIGHVLQDRPGCGSSMPRLSIRGAPGPASSSPRTPTGAGRPSSIPQHTHGQPFNSIAVPMQ